MSAATGEPVPLRRNRDFQLLWSGQAVSLLGSQMSRIAYPLLVLAMTGSPAKAGIAGFAAMLGYLLFPLPAGGAGRPPRPQADHDRLRRDPAGRGGQHRRGRLGRAHHLRAGAGGRVRRGHRDRVLRPGRSAPRCRCSFTRPSGRWPSWQNEARQNAAQLAGPALGGALFGLSRAAPFAADALSYLASLVTLPFIKTPMQAAPARAVCLGSRPAPRGGCGPSSARGWPLPGGSRSCATARSSPRR